jgi:hypothetical protein
MKLVRSHIDLHPSCDKISGVSFGGVRFSAYGQTGKLVLPSTIQPGLPDQPHGGLRNLIFPYSRQHLRDFEWSRGGTASSSPSIRCGLALSRRECCRSSGLSFSRSLPDPRLGAHQLRRHGEMASLRRFRRFYFDDLYVRTRFGHLSNWFVRKGDGWARPGREAWPPCSFPVQADLPHRLAGRTRSWPSSSWW